MSDSEPQPPPPDELTYEQAVEQLERIVERIESGEVGLEAALRQYESGTELIKRCRGILDTAEKRIAELTADSQGNLAVEGENGENGEAAKTPDPEAADADDADPDGPF